MEKIRFDDLKLIPIGSVLRHYGVELKKQGDYFVALKCPLPSHTSKEPFTFKAHATENWWRCWSESCNAALGKKGGDVVDFVALKENLKPIDAARKLCDLFALNQNAPQEVRRNGSRFSDEKHDSAVKNKPLGFTLQGNPEHSMIQGRGISVETARTFQVGYYASKQGTASMDNRIIFPLHEDGNLVGYIGRTVNGQEPRWKVPKDFHKTMLFGLERCDPRHHLFVVEACWEVLLLFQKGVQAVALLGSSMTAEQERKLDPFRMIWLMLDDDEAGKKASAEIYERLRARHRVIRAFLKD